MKSLFGAAPAKLLAGPATSTIALARRPAVASAEHATRFRVLVIALISLLGVRGYSPALRCAGLGTARATISGFSRPIQDRLSARTDPRQELVEAIFERGIAVAFERR